MPSRSQPRLTHASIARPDLRARAARTSASGASAFSFSSISDEMRHAVLGREPQQLVAGVERIRHLDLIGGRRAVGRRARVIDDEAAADRVVDALDERRVAPAAPSAVNRMPFACSGSFSRRWNTSDVAGSSSTSCLPSSLMRLRLRRRAATRFATESTSTVAGSSPSSPRMTALSLPWPLPVKPRLPNSSTFTPAICASWPSASSRSANRRAARIGPTVCELDGPMPILKMSKTEMCKRASLQSWPSHERLRTGCAS